MVSIIKNNIYNEETSGFNPCSNGLMVSIQIVTRYKTGAR